MSVTREAIEAAEEAIRDAVPAPIFWRVFGRARCGHSLAACSLDDGYCQLPGCWNDYQLAVNHERD